MTEARPGSAGTGEGSERNPLRHTSASARREGEELARAQRCGGGDVFEERRHQSALPRHSRLFPGQRREPPCPGASVSIAVM